MLLVTVFCTPFGTMADNNFEAQISQFPESYKSQLRALHSKHPSWVFFADKISMSFDEAVNAEYSVPFRKGVNMNSDGISWRSMNEGCYDWGNNRWITFDNNNWTGAAREVIAYYMDPRNFLNSSDIYMFLQQSYDRNVQNADGLRQIVNGTFLAGTYNDPNDTAYGGSYVNTIMAAAEQTNVNPYVIAAIIIIEQGNNGTSQLISGNYPGYERYYNFFNFGATGANVTASGLAYAKSRNWNSRSASIIGGAERYADNYINAGQDTYYYKDFNVRNGNLNHQYSQNVYDARSLARSLARKYNAAGMNARETMMFYIPVYSSMPSSPPDKPAETNARSNYYLTSISVAGLSPSFGMYNYNYNLSVSGDTVAAISLLPGTSVVSPTAYSLSPGNNTVNITVRAENGYTNTYTINVNSSSACTFTVTTDMSAVKVIRGDTNSDGKIDVIDLANIQKHIVGRITLGGADLAGADTNGDGSVNVIDLANVQKHIVGRITLK